MKVEISQHSGFVNYSCCGNLIAKHIIVNLFSDSGVNFISDPSDYFQVGIMNRTHENPVMAHTHNAIIRQINLTSEFLYIVDGKSEACFSCHCKPVEKSVVQLIKGEALVFYGHGIHSLEFLEPTKVIEIKQGPYIDTQDKRVINSQ
jgi:hypothetical protein